MRPKLWLCLLLCSLVPLAYTQDRCSAVVVDDAGILKGGAEVRTAAQSLTSQGADVHVVTLTSLGTLPNLDQAEKSIEQQCPSWRNTAGGRKSTLIVEMMAAKERQVGVYYGSAWDEALGNRWNAIKAQYIVPRFKDGDFAGGFAAGLQQMGARITAARSEVQHGPTTINQSTPMDFSGFYTFLKWLLAVGVLFGIGGFLFYLWRKREEDASELKGAQTNAINARNFATSRWSRVKDLLDTARTTGSYPAANIEKAQALYDGASADYSNLAASFNMDPSHEGLTQQTYRSIQTSYQAITTAFAAAESALRGVVPEPVRSTPTRQAPSSTPPPRSRAHRHQEEPKHSTTQSESSRASSTTPESTPLYVPPIVVVNNETYNESREEKSHSSSQSSSSSSSSSNDDDSSRGGSSSWGSDSGSSSSDFGGSSSFDSGSSGGGGDSGGGGGSSDY